MTLATMALSMMVYVQHANKRKYNCWAFMFGADFDAGMLVEEDRVPPPVVDGDLSRGPAPPTLPVIAPAGGDDDDEDQVVDDLYENQLDNETEDHGNDSDHDSDSSMGGDDEDENFAPLPTNVPGKLFYSKVKTKSHDSVVCFQ